MKNICDIFEGFGMKKRALVYATRAWVHFNEGLGINAEGFGMSGHCTFFGGGWVFEINGMPKAKGYIVKSNKNAKSHHCCHFLIMLEKTTNCQMGEFRQ